MQWTKLVCSLLALTNCTANIPKVVLLFSHNYIRGYCGRNRRGIPNNCIHRIISVRVIDIKWKLNDLQSWRRLLHCSCFTVSVSYCAGARGEISARVTRVITRVYLSERQQVVFLAQNNFNVLFIMIPAWQFCHFKVKIGVLHSEEAGDFSLTNNRNARIHIHEYLKSKSET